MRLLATGLVSTAAIFAGVTSAFAQNYPDKPIHIYAAPAGGGVDYVARVLSSELPDAVGQPGIVENRPTLIAIETAKSLPPDGYGVIVMGLPLWLLPLVQDVSWDPVKDFAPISVVTKQPLVLVVHPSLPVSSVKELIDYAKANPGKLNMGTAGVGSSPEISANLFKAKANINVVTVPYNGTAPAVTAILSNEVQALFATPSTAASLIESGKLRALGVTSPQKTPLFPSLPPISDTVPGYDVVEDIAMFAPAKTPAAVIHRLNDAVVKILKKPDVQQKFVTARVEVGSSTPEELGAKVKSDLESFGKVITKAPPAAK